MRWFPTTDPITKEPKLSAINAEGKTITAKTDASHKEVMASGKGALPLKKPNYPLLVFYIFIQMIFGILGGIGASVENLVFMKQKADELFGRDSYQWSVLGAGKHQMTLATQGALMGSHVRVGLEDSLFISRGKLAASNAEQVEKIANILTLLGFDIATPAEARETLGLKGGDRVSF